MIVKVQVSMPDRKRTIIYDEGRVNLWEGNTSRHVVVNRS